MTATGPFSNDPRGISVRDGLVYVIDGKSDFEDEDTGEQFEGGIMVFVFAGNDTAGGIEQAMPYLPYWE